MRFSHSLSLLLAASAAAHSHANYAEFSRHAAIPPEWSIDHANKPDLSSEVRMSIHLKQKDVDKFEKHVLDISTPGHTLYGQHMSQDEVNDMIKPAPKTVHEVVKWLCDCGMKHNHVVKNDWIYVNATLADVERMLQTKYETFVHAENNERKIRTTAYSLPKHLHDHVNMITPTTVLGQLKGLHSHILPSESNYIQKLDARVRPRQLGAAQGPCNATVTPACLRSIYNIPAPTAQPADNVFGIAGFLEQYVQDKDLTQFLTEYAPFANGQSYTFESINGGLNTQGSKGGFEEANLDIQYGIGIAAPVKTIYYQTAGRPPISTNPSTGTDNTNEPYLDFLNYVLALPSPPATITTSYGEDEQTVPEDYARSVCNKFAQLGARGVSIVFSSGDGGPGTVCKDFATSKNALQATFPASCPWVTGVGATTGVPERAVSFSGGGFSKYWPAQPYQKTAIANWKRQAGNLNSGLYPATGRGVPDVSAQGYAFGVIVSGSESRISGTSAASPVFGAIIALINGALIGAGKPRLGFLNPWIYGNGLSGFNDITTGTSNGCTSDLDGIRSAAWPATQGWDPVTGVGTPDYAKLVQLALTNPQPATDTQAALAAANAGAPSQQIASTVPQASIPVQQSSVVAGQTSDQTNGVLGAMAPQGSFLGRSGSQAFQQGSFQASTGFAQSSTPASSNYYWQQMYLQRMQQMQGWYPYWG